MKNRNEYRVLDVPAFENDLIKIAKKYPSIIEEISNLFDSFEKGEIQGDPVPRLKLEGNKVFKTRMPNPDANKGKSSGFRVIWYLVTTRNDIYPITIYSKSDQTDIKSTEITKLIRDRLKV